MAERDLRRRRCSQLRQLVFVVKTLPVGTAYAVWAGIGAVGVAIAGVVWFHDVFTLWRTTFIALIVVGLVGPAIARAVTRPGPSVRTRRTPTGP